MTSLAPLTPTWRRLLLPLGLAFALSGCNEDMSDLREYIDEVRQRPGGRIDPMPEMQPFTSYSYPEDPGRDPFRTLSFAEPERVASGDEVASGPRPDPTRPREPLEDYSLDSLAYVGTIERESQRWALVRDPGGTIHQVQSGNHMGQNYGKVTGVTPTKLRLRELVRTQRGTWIERDAAIALND